MLQIGSRSYRLVRGPSAFHVTLNPNERDHWQQVWRLDAHFVPDDGDCGPELHGQWEYWWLAVNPMAFFQVTDWRDLARGSFFEDGDADPFMFNANIENLITLGAGRAPVRSLILDEFRVTQQDGYFFTCEMAGEIEPARDGEEKMVSGEFQWREEIPFATATVEVPLNAGDPLATGRAIAAREIGLTEVARTSVTLFDSTRKVWKPERAGKHTVTLETPWRRTVA